MSHKDAPPETPTQTACREFWQAAQPHVKRAWGQAKDGSFLAEESRLLHRAWEAGGALSPPSGGSEFLEWVAAELVARKSLDRAVTQGVASTLRGQARLMRVVSGMRDKGGG